MIVQYILCRYLLSRYPWLDSERVGVMGSGYGGFLAGTLLANSRQDSSSGAVKCGVMVAPITDWRLTGESNYYLNWILLRGIQLTHAQRYMQGSTVKMVLSCIKFLLKMRPIHFSGVCPLCRAWIHLFNTWIDTCMGKQSDTGPLDIRRYFVRSCVVRIFVLERGVGEDRRKIRRKNGGPFIILKYSMYQLHIFFYLWQNSYLWLTHSTP
jgi:hypothetical protein